jgi:FkbM family methyltransferase
MKSSTLLQMLTLRGHTILPGPLGSSSTVVDLGANRGEFARQAQEHFHCRVVAVEANPRLVPDVAAVPGVEAYHYAIAGRDGEATFHFSEESEAGALATGITGATGECVTVPTRTLASLLREANVNRVDLLKVDIEGAEIELFDSLSDSDIGRFDQITLEFHDFCDLVTPADVWRICERLQGLGYDSIRFGGWDDRSDNLNWLFVRPGLPRAGCLRRAYVKHVVRRMRNTLHRMRYSKGRHRLAQSATTDGGC